MAVARRRFDAPLSWRGALLRSGTRWLLRPVFAGDLPYTVRRKRLARVARGLGQLALGISLAHDALGEVPAEWLRPDGDDAGTVLLYLHGGAYVAGSAAVYRRLLSRLARRGGLRIVAVDYRLAPEHPFPAALDDALAAYRELLASTADGERVLLGGDSAGGGLALATALAARDAGLALPAGLVLLSPWVDLTLSGASAIERVEREVLLGRERLAADARAYAGDADLRNPLISPLFADLRGLPPLLIQVGGDEILYDDAGRLARAAAAAGVSVQLQEWTHGWHVWQALAGLLPEADAALAEIAAFIAAPHRR